MFLSHSAAAASASSSSRDRLRASNSGVKYLMASFSWHAWAAIRRTRGPQAIVRRGESGAKPSGRVLRAFKEHPPLVCDVSTLALDCQHKADNVKLVTSESDKQVNSST